MGSQPAGSDEKNMLINTEKAHDGEREWFPWMAFIYILVLEIIQNKG